MFSAADEEASKQLTTDNARNPARAKDSLQSASFRKKSQEFSGKEQDSLDLWISYVRLTFAEG